MRSLTLSAILCWALIILGLFHSYESALLLKDAVARPRFEFFKQKYKKTYKTELHENQAYVNFVNNWNEVEKVNGMSTNANETYMLNSFADLSPAYIHQHYAVNVTPYDNEVGETMASKALRESKQKADNVILYDLENAEELYKNYLKKFRKPKYGKTKHIWSYMKFIQTLANLNKHNLLNNDKKTLDIHADELKQPKNRIFT